MADLKLNKVIKRFGEVETIHGVDLNIKHGEFVVFVGPSGCGKSTLLRMIAGLETISDGEVIIDGLTVNEVSPSDRITSYNVCYTKLLRFQDLQSCEAVLIYHSQTDQQTPRIHRV